MHRLLARLAVFALACAALALAAPAHAQAPTITGFTPTSGPVGTSVVLTGTNFTGTTLVGFQNKHAVSFTVNSNTQITTSVPSGAATGPVAVATPGGTAHSSASFTVTVAVPTITSFAPTSGPVGTSVTITGTNFTGATAVTFNGTTATTFSVVSATSITATVPTGATTGTISVTTPGGTATSSASFTVTVPAPTITSFNPTSGPVGTSVVITGTNFTGTTVVGFQNKHAVSFTVNSPTQITTSVPSGAATGPIAVATPGGTAHSTGSFTVTTGGSAPTITSFMPTLGPTGTSVTITGTNFTGATAVKFNGTAAASFTVVSATSITVTVPAGAMTGTISVTTSSGTGTSGSSFTVTSLAIDCGSTSGVTSGGLPWEPDNGSPSPVTTGRMATTTVSSFTNLPSGVPYQVFQSQRLSDGSTLTGGGTGFSFTESTIANGNYTLTLYFAEINTNVSAGKRTFNVLVNGTPVLMNFDIYRIAGTANAVVSESFPVSITNGQLSIVYQDVMNATATYPALAAAFALTPPARPATDVPPPGWGGDVVPSDGGTDGGSTGPGSSLGVSLPSQVEENTPGPDISAYNPLGPGVAYERMYRGNRAKSGYASPGLSAGWTDNYDVSVLPVTDVNHSVIGYTLQYPNGAVDSWSGATGSLTVPAGAPYLAYETNGVSGNPNTIEMEFKDRTVYTFTQYAAPSSSYPAGTYLLTKITNIVGHAAIISRDTTVVSNVAVNNYRLMTVKNDGSTVATLLTFSYSGSHLATVKDTASPSVSEQREVDYQFSAANLLTDVTWIEPITTGFVAAYDLWNYSYQTIASQPYLQAVKTPDPGSTSASSLLYTSATVTFDSTGLVQSQVDGNSHQRRYTPLPGGGVTSSVFSLPGDTVPVEQWTDFYAAGMGKVNAETGVRDGDGNQASLSYAGSPSSYLPMVGTDRNGHPVTLTYVTKSGASNSYGNVGTTLDNRGDTITITHMYPAQNQFPANFDLGEVTKVQEANPGANMTRQATTFDYYQPADGAIDGLPKDVVSPSPTGNPLGGTTVTTTFHYTAPSPTAAGGNISELDSPGNGEASTTYKTTFAYTTGGTPPIQEAVGEPLTATDNDMKVTQFSYDGRGNRLSVTDPSTYLTQYAYNLANQIQMVTYPLTGDVLPSKTDTHAFTLYSYLYPGGPLDSIAVYAEGNASLMNPDRMVTYKYDHEGQVVEVDDLKGVVFKSTYDARGRVTKVADGDGNATSYVYDPAGNLIQVLYPGHQSVTPGTKDTVTYGYDPDQNLISRTDGRNITMTYARVDPESQISGINYGTLPGTVTSIGNVSFTYDGFGRRATMLDGTGKKTYSYGDLDELSEVKTDFTGGPSNLYLSYAYEPDGSLYVINTPLDTQLAANNATGTMQYGHDDLGRVTNVIFPWDGETTLDNRVDTIQHAYQPNGWISQTFALNAGVGTTETDTTFDARGFLTGLKTTSLGNDNFTQLGQVFSDFEAVNSSSGIAHDVMGNLKSVCETVPAQVADGSVVPSRGALPDGGRTLSYAYDTRDEMSTEDSALLPGATMDPYSAAFNYGFAFDSAYNATMFRGTSYPAVNPDNQVTGTGFGFDADGNASTYSGIGLTFDPEDRLTAIPSMGFSAAYDGDGQRATKTVGGTTTYYLYDGDHLLYEADGTGKVTAFNGWAADGLRVRYNTATDNTFYDTYNLSGNLSQRLAYYGDTTTFNLGAQDTRVYDGYGKLRGRVDVLSSDPADVVGFGGQSGYYTDAETGLDLLGARYYDGGTGRFLNRDPIGYAGGENLYGFCGNNPVNESDPEGTNAAGDFVFGVLDNFDSKKIQAGLVGLASYLGTHADNEGPALSALGKGFVKGLNPLTAPNARVAGQRVGGDLMMLAAGAGLAGKLRSLGAAGAAVEAESSAGVLAEAATNCFVAGTLVQMADGTTKQVQDVREGDLVLSRNPETGATEAKPVLAHSVKIALQVLTLTLVDRLTHLTQTITCTPGHPFYVEGQGFVLAVDLGIGTSIVTRAGPCLVVAAVHYEPKSSGGVLVYNFTVEDDHTYFVGTANGGVWVHNASVALDTNALIAAVEGSPADQAAVQAAIGGRTPIIPITVVKEFLVRGDISALRNYLASSGGRIGAAGDAATVSRLMSLGLRTNDARVAASAMREGVQLITRDQRLINRTPGTGVGF